MTKAKAKAKKGSNTVDTTTLDPSTKEPMCIISKDALQAVLDWVEGPGMTMPHNQVCRCKELILTAKLVNVEVEEVS